MSDPLQSAVSAAFPVDAVIPDLSRALAARPNAVLVAPPGAGKTTRVPLALLDAPWRRDGRILVLEPRRLAARAAARRMAQTLGEEAGETVGYRVRMESRASARTRVEIITEGVFTRMIQADPSLEGVAAVLFDEFHERSLDGDLGLALALDAQAGLREDLRVLVMSATIDGARVAALLGEAAIIESRGRMFPVETRHQPRDPALRVEEAVASVIRKALAEETGSLLVFLPGQAEIRRVAERLEGRLPPGVDVAPLYGALDFAAQDRAIRPAAAGRRKVVLASAIAETSLTIEGVRVVVDSGLARRPRYEPATGLTRLETHRVSRAAADQRRGRAGRTEPGICYRLWDEGQTAALAPFDRPEILEADLAPLVLDLAHWGVIDPAALAFLDPPPRPAWEEAVALLSRLDALDGDRRLTEEGRALAQLGVAPRLGHMLRRGAALGLGGLAGAAAVLLEEPGLGGHDTDLGERLRRLRSARDPRSRDAMGLAARLARNVGADPRQGIDAAERAGLLLAFAFPERIAMARGAPGAFVLANGRGALLDAADPLARAPFLAVAALQGAAENARILTAAPIDRAEIEAHFAAAIETESVVVFDQQTGSVRGRQLRRLGRLVLGEKPLKDLDEAAARSALVAEIRRRGLSSLGLGSADAFRARLAFLHAHFGAPWPDMSDAALESGLEDWLGPFLAGKRRLDAVNAGLVREALDAQVSWEMREALDRLAPSHFAVPTGSRIPIDYSDPAAPVLAVRVQELFGLDRHPAIGGGTIPLVVSLLSPAHRPIQITRDLPSFWRGSWRDVRSDMRGRYPKHVWPEDPLAAAPTARAKPRGT